MRPQLAMHFTPPGKLWARVAREDSIAAELADGHYSRQTPGADGYMAPGECVAFVHKGPRGRAVWGVVHNVFREVWRWRNTIFRNVSGTLSSDLIIAATLDTYETWLAEYGKLPAPPLRTEVEIEATRARRSKRHPPGHCYLMAGWTFVREIPAAHGRAAKVELEAPPHGADVAATIDAYKSWLEEYARADPQTRYPPARPPTKPLDILVT